MEHTQTQIPDKLFYKVTEVCQITDTQPYVLRFWESEFPQLASEKNRSGQRVYRREDIDLIFRIKRLLYEEEYTIAGARKAIDGGQETIVDPPPRVRPRASAQPEDEAPPRLPVEPPAPAPSLFGEARPEAPPETRRSAGAEEEARYRALYEEMLTTVDVLKGDLARIEADRTTVLDRQRRVAARLQAALDT